MGPSLSASLMRGGGVGAPETDNATMTAGLWLLTSQLRKRESFCIPGGAAAPRLRGRPT